MKTITKTILIALSAATLASCAFATGRNSEASSAPSSASQGGSQGGDSSSEGSFAWPEEEIEEFLDLFDIDVTIPKIDLPSDAQYEALIDDATYGTEFYLYCVDNGTAGKDAYEDAYKTIVESSGFVCFNDDTYTYDDYGYCYADPNDLVSLVFYTYEGYFSIEIIPNVETGGDGYTNGSYEFTDSFPKEEMDAFLSYCGLTDTVPAMSYDGDWAVYYFVNDDDYGTSVCAQIEDSGTVGSNSLEDQYKAICEAAGFTNGNDSTYTYEDYGYFYDKGSLELQFYTYSGYFTLMAYEY